jgi:hypothetical protein
LKPTTDSLQPPGKRRWKNQTRNEFKGMRLTDHFPVVARPGCHRIVTGTELIFRPLRSLFRPDSTWAAGGVTGGDEFPLPGLNCGLKYPKPVAAPNQSMVEPIAMVVVSKTNLSDSPRLTALAGVERRVAAIPDIQSLAAFGL